MKQWRETAERTAEIVPLGALGCRIPASLAAQSPRCFLVRLDGVRLLRVSHLPCRRPSRHAGHGGDRLVWQRVVEPRSERPSPRGLRLRIRAGQLSNPCGRTVAGHLWQRRPSGCRLTSAEALQSQCAQQCERCLYTSASLFIWLRFLRMARIAFVIVPIIFGAFARWDLLQGQDGEVKTVTATLALLAGLVPTIYAALKLDEHLANGSAVGRRV